MPFQVVASQTRKNLIFCTLDVIGAMPWVLLSLPGSFIAASLLNSLFKIGPFWFGIVTAMPAIANAIHIFIVPFFSRFMTVRDMVVTFGWLNLGAWMGAALGIAYLPLDQPDQAGLFFTLFYGLISLSSSFMGITWMKWVGDFVPGRVRGRYFAKRSIYAYLSTIVFMLLSMGILELLDASRTAYLYLIWLALFGRLVSLLFVLLIQSPDPSGGRVSTTNWASEVVALRKNIPLLRIIAFGSFAGFWMGFIGALAAMFLLDGLGVSPARFTSYSIVATLAGAACLPLWGKLIDRHGAIPVVIITFFLWRVIDLGWVFITEESLNWLYLIWASGGINGTGFLVASFALLLKMIPKESKAAGISLNLTR